MRLNLGNAAFGVLLSVIELGFIENNQPFFLHAFLFISLVSSVLTTLFVLKSIKAEKNSILIVDLLIILFGLFIFSGYYNFVNLQSLQIVFESTVFVKSFILIVFIRELTKVQVNYKKTQLSPPQLFIGSFIFIIVMGSLFLSLPNATYTGISYLDAFFTSTSAVCVTGLIVVDTGSYFTPFGQFIIISLIQIGGIGILTFASYFSFFFKGGATYDNQQVLRDVTNSQKLSEVYSALKGTIIITFIVEVIGAISVFFTLEGNTFPSLSAKIFFAVFHSISAFCNAGFSTLGDSLYAVEFRYNYPLQLIVFFTFFMGGLGFPIVANSVNYFKYLLKRISSFSKRSTGYRPWVLSITSRITLITTFSITLIAVPIFMLLEFNNSLAEHASFFGKVVVSLFSAATPRTAGFNVIDTSSMLFSTTMLVFLLMWIGASPGSTGGGIKTSTFAIATLNFMSLAKGKSRIEVFRREIADVSVRRAFAVISLSLVVIGLAIALLSATEPHFDLISIAFEVFSAYSTVGLSLGITAELGNVSRVILIILMFVGRIGMLTLMVALFQNTKYKNYRYPTEEILIN